MPVMITLFYDNKILRYRYPIGYVDLNIKFMYSVLLIKSAEKEKLDFEKRILHLLTFVK